MRSLALVIGICLVVSLSWIFAGGLLAEEPVVHALLFYSATCPHCEVVRDEVLPPMLDHYGTRLEIREMDIADARNFALMLGFETMYHVPEDEVGIPEIFIGDDYLVGEIDIGVRLEGLVERYLAQGGVPYPVLSRDASATLDAQVQQGQVSLAPSPTSGPEKAVAAFYLFWDSRCEPCVKLRNETLPDMLLRYDPGQVSLHEFDLERGGYEMMHALEADFGLQAGAMPEVFIGDQVLLGVEDIESRLPGLIDRYLGEGGVALPAPGAPKDAAAAQTAPSGAAREAEAGGVKIAPLATGALCILLALAALRGHSRSRRDGPDAATRPPGLRRVAWLMLAVAIVAFVAGAVLLLASVA